MPLLAGTPSSLEKGYIYFKDDDAVVGRFGGLCSGHSIDLKGVVSADVRFRYDVEAQTWRSQVSLMVHDVCLIKKNKIKD